MVYLTFDDAVTIQNYPMYEELFFDRKNPNGQPITLSFYVTHEYNDYSLVHQLWRRGHDISLHSISHQTNTQYWKDLNSTGWRMEIAEQRAQLAHFANISEEAVSLFYLTFSKINYNFAKGKKKDSYSNFRLQEFELPFFKLEETPW